MPLYDARLPRRDEKLGCYPSITILSARIGACAFPPWPPHCKRRVVVDADGIEYDYILWMDTDSGELCRYVRENNRFVLDPKTGLVATVTEKLPPPLELIPYAEELPA